MKRWLPVCVAAVAVVAVSGAFGVSGNNTITTIAGTGKSGFSGDGGPAIRAQLGSPHGVAVDGQGSVYIADYRNYRVRKVTRGGTITTFATVPSSVSPGTPGLVRGVAVDRHGRVYVSEEFGTVYRISANGKTITRIAGIGNGLLGFSGDGGPATSAQLGSLEGVAVDGKGNVYIADSSNNRVRKVSPQGTITTIAGTGGDQFSGDGGPATSAQLAAPSGIAVDRLGNVYVGDESDRRVRRVSPQGTITTFAGGGGAFPGDGGPATNAKLGNVTGVAVDAQGNVYFADWSNGRVRKVSPQGTITTIAGGGKASSGTNGPATSVWLSYPDGVAIDGTGLYIVEGNRVRKVTAAPAPGPVTATATGTVLVNGKPYTGGPIPYGSKVDVTAGKVTLKADVGTLTASGGGGITAQFVLRRLKADGKPIVELGLTGGTFATCPKARRRSAALTKKPPKTVRRLWTKGKGSFRTRGRYASGTIRGTDWLTEDRCDGTFVKTRQGIVAVFDFAAKKTVLVNAGQSYATKKPASTPAAAAKARVGDFAGPMVFRNPDGSIQQTQYARLSVDNATRTQRRASVRWTYTPVGWTAPAVCTHNLEETSVNQQGAVLFRVSSMTGSCIPNAKSYSISLKQDRAATHLFYAGGLTASGSLPRR